MKAACIDAYRGRFGVGPICRALSAGPDCGFLTARGYRAFKTRPLSRMAARREALARDITSIHGDEFVRVYGYRKVWRQLLDQGWDPLEAGRDQVARIMRELGLRGVRGGRRPVTTIPARGTGGRLGLAGRKFAARAPNRLHVADITYVRLADGSFAYAAFVTDAYARRIVGWAVASTMRAGELPLQAPEQAIAWARAHGGTEGCVHHSDHGSQYVSLQLGRTMRGAGIVPSMGSISSPWDNAAMESLMGLIKAECVHARTFETREQAALEIFDYIECFYNRKRIHSALGYLSPEEFERANRPGEGRRPMAA